MRPYLEKPFTKNRAVGVSQSVGLVFKPQHHKKTKQNRKNLLIVVTFREKAWGRGEDTGRWHLLCMFLYFVFYDLNNYLFSKCII
jgi:hypothetical protein